MENLQKGVDRALDRFDQKTFAHEEKISEKSMMQYKPNCPFFWLVRNKNSWEIQMHFCRGHS